MKNLIIAIILIGCANIELAAQKITDKKNLECTYIFKSKRFFANGTNETVIDTMTLEIGNKMSKFYSKINRFTDSIRKTVPMDFWGAYKKTGNLYTIYVNYPENKITVTDVPMLSPTAEYIEDMKINWSLTKETAKILSYNCKNAVCDYKGRIYNVWYAPAIPTNKGPYKFCGLPGLIMKVTDGENLFDFECIAVEKKSGNIVKDDKKAKNMSRSDFMTINKRFFDNPKQYILIFFKETNTSIDPNQIVKQPYNPIELE